MEAPKDQVYVKLRRIEDRGNVETTLRGDPRVRLVHAFFSRDEASLAGDVNATARHGARPLGLDAPPDLRLWLRIIAKGEDAAQELQAALTDQSILKDQVERFWRATYLGEQGALVSLSNLWASCRDFLRLGPTLQAGDESQGQGFLGSAPPAIGAADVECWPLLPRADLPIRVAVVDNFFYKTTFELRDLRSRTTFSGVEGYRDDHGTKVLGVLFAAVELKGRPQQGLVGLTPEAKLVFSHPYVMRDNERVYSVADAINRAAEHLSHGDVLLIEQQFNRGPIELIPVCYDAIKSAAAKGILVIEPAGNGEINLDEQIFPDGTKGGAGGTSGAIMVASCRLPPNQEHSEHVRFPTSCFGRRVDAFSWGEGVLTTTADAQLNSSVGAGSPLATGHKLFQGTSSASAIVAGVAAVASSIVRRLGGKVHPEQFRDMLRSTGSPPGVASEPIGTQPDLPRLLRALRSHLYRQRQDEPGWIPQVPQRHDFNDVQKRVLDGLVCGLTPSEVVQREQVFLRIVGRAPIAPNGDVAVSVEQAVSAIEQQLGRLDALRLGYVAAELGL